MDKEEDPSDEITNSEKVFNNSVIIEKIFRKLDFWEWQQFRLVRKRWRDETLQIWRNNVELHVLDDGFRAFLHKGLSLELFSRLLQSQESEDGVSGEDIRQELIEVPFRRCLIHYEDLILPSPRGRRPGADLFWEVVGSQLLHLNLEKCSIYKNRCFEMFQWLLLEACPLLESLNIEISDEREEEESRDDDGSFKKNEKTPGNCLIVAQHLTKLEYSALVEVPSSKNILSLMPNLKTLIIKRDGLSILDGLSRPTASGNYINLEELVIESAQTFRIPYFPSLRTYTEACPNTLKSFSAVVDLVFVRDNARDFYIAISQCKNLQKLDLTLFCFDGETPDCHWFMDLAYFEFPKLIKFVVNISSSASHIQFDFGTLRGMKKLEELEINYETYPDVQRMNLHGTNDWIYEGPWDLFPIADVINFGRDPNHLQQVPISLPKLEKLTFDGWTVNPPDVDLFKEWFPSVKYVKAAFYSTSLSSVLDDLEQFPLLEQLVLTAQSRAELKTLAEAKGWRPWVKMSVITTQCGEMEVVLGENNRAYLKEMET